VHRYVVHRHLHRAGLSFGIADGGPKGLAALDEIASGHHGIQRRIQSLPGDRGEKAHSPQVYPQDWSFPGPEKSGSAQQRAVPTEGEEGIEVH